MPATSSTGAGARRSHSGRERFARFVSKPPTPDFGAVSVDIEAPLVRDIPVAKGDDLTLPTPDFSLVAGRALTPPAPETSRLTSRIFTPLPAETYDISKGHLELPATDVAPVPQQDLNLPVSDSATVEFAIEAVAPTACDFAPELPEFASVRFRRPISPRPTLGGVKRPPGAARSQAPRSRGMATLLRSLEPILMAPVRVGAPDELELPHRPYAFQGDGVEFLRSHDAALLADDMGLGKTVQAILALRALIRHGQALRALIVSPKSVQTSWMRHLRDWAPELRAIEITGSPNDRPFLWRQLQTYGAHVGVVTYGTLRRDVEMELAAEEPYDVLILDEIQSMTRFRSSRILPPSRAAPSARSRLSAAGA